jgi:hypothetical protein
VTSTRAVPCGNKSCTDAAPELEGA